MFPRSQRLPLSSRKRFVGHRCSGPYFSLTYTLNSLTYSRTAAVVNKKCSPLSTGRHLLKRRLLHLLRPCLAAKHLDCLLVAYPAALKQPFSNLKQEMERCCSLLSTP